MSVIISKDLGYIEAQSVVIQWNSTRYTLDLEDPVDRMIYNTAASIDTLDERIAANAENLGAATHPDAIAEYASQKLYMEGRRVGEANSLNRLVWLRGKVTIA